MEEESPQKEGLGKKEYISTRPIQGYRVTLYRGVLQIYLSRPYTMENVPVDLGRGGKTPGELGLLAARGLEDHILFRPPGFMNYLWLAIPPETAKWIEEKENG